MKLLVGIPSDVLLEILREWLKTIEYGFLDMACTNQFNRDYFLTTLKSVPIFQYSLDKKFYNWIFIRNIPVKRLVLDSCSFGKNGTLEYGLNPEHVELLEIEYLGDKWEPASRVISACKSLKTLNWDSNGFAECLPFISNFNLVRKLVFGVPNDPKIILEAIAERCTLIEHLVATVDSADCLDLFRQVFIKNPNLRVLDTLCTIDCSMFEDCCPNIEDLCFRAEHLSVTQLASLIGKRKIKRIITADGRSEFRYAPDVQVIEISSPYEIDSSELSSIIDVTCNMRRVIFNGFHKLPENFFERNYSTIEEMFMEDVRLSNQTLRDFLQRCPLLSILSFDGFLGNSNEVAELFKQYQPPNLRAIAASDARINIAALTEIVTSCPKLDHCEMGDLLSPTKEEMDTFSRLLTMFKFIGRKIDCAVTYEMDGSLCCFQYNNGQGAYGGGAAGGSSDGSDLINQLFMLNDESDDDFAYGDEEDDEPDEESEAI